MLREDHRLRVSENRTLRRIFGTKREKNREVRNDCIRRSFINYARMGQTRNAFIILVGNPEGKTPLGKT
jgi:hypothetical protein